MPPSPCLLYFDDSIGSYSLTLSLSGSCAFLCSILIVILILNGFLISLGLTAILICNCCTSTSEPVFCLSRGLLLGWLMYTLESVPVSLTPFGLSSHLTCYLYDRLFSSLRFSKDIRTFNRLVRTY
jgi:hypothetical protein